jgi:hypothetical protein
MRALEGFVEVRLRDPQDFLKIRETLTRIGVPHRVDELDVLVQVCHILHKRGLYYITHYKELQTLDGKIVSISDDDLSRRDTIARLLAKWGLCELADERMDETVSEHDLSMIKIVPYRDKDKWLLKCKYEVGKKARPALYKEY